MMPTNPAKTRASGEFPYAIAITLQERRVEPAATLDVTSGRHSRENKPFKQKALGIKSITDETQRPQQHPATPEFPLNVAVASWYRPFSFTFVPWSPGCCLRRAHNSVPSRPSCWRLLFDFQRRRIDPGWTPGYPSRRSPRLTDHVDTVPTSADSRAIWTQAKPSQAKLSLQSQGDVHHITSFHLASWRTSQNQDPYCATCSTQSLAYSRLLTPCDLNLWTTGCTLRQGSKRFAVNKTRVLVPRKQHP